MVDRPVPPLAPTMIALPDDSAPTGDSVTMSLAGSVTRTETGPVMNDKGLVIGAVVGPLDRRVQFGSIFDSRLVSIRYLRISEASAD
jgi:hypothetical protein